MQRDVVALIRASGARITILSEARLFELWREYSQRNYSKMSADVHREEVFRFITWCNNVHGIAMEILGAQQRAMRAVTGIRIRRHPVQAWSKRLHEKRLT